MPPVRPYTGKLSDPQFRHQRAVNAALARNSIDAHIQKVVDAAPDLTAEQLEKLAVLLRGGGD